MLSYKSWNSVISWILGAYLGVGPTEFLYVNLPFRKFVASFYL
jgi:hypothetical protein